MTVVTDAKDVEADDRVKAEFNGAVGTYMVEGVAWLDRDGALMVGCYDTLCRNGRQSGYLVAIHEHHPKPRPYAEGTDRTEPQFGDVVEDETQDWWIYLPRDSASKDMNPWHPVEPVHQVLEEPFGNVTARKHRDDLSARLRLVRELRDAGGGDS